MNEPEFFATLLRILTIGGVIAVFCGAVIGFVWGLLRGAADDEDADLADARAVSARPTRLDVPTEPRPLVPRAGMRNVRDDLGGLESARRTGETATHLASRKPH